MLRKLGLWLARALDVLGWKSVSRSLFASLAQAGDGEYVVYWAAWGRMRRGDVGGAEDLLRGHFATHRSGKVGRLLVHLLLRQGRRQEAREVAADLQRSHPGNPWFLLLLGDMHAYFGGDREFAVRCYERALPEARTWRDWESPVKVVYKRLAQVYWAQGDYARLVPLLEEFAALRPSNFYASGFEMLYRAHLALGHGERAQEVLRWGLQEMPRNRRLKVLAAEAGLCSETGPAPAGGAGEGKTCVRTRLLTEADDPVAAVQEHVSAAEQSEVLALSSCVAGVMEGRFQMAGAIAPCWTARVMSRFVDQTYVPFGGGAPLSSPLSMQVLLEEVGTVRVWLAAMAGVAGRLLGRKGWFYLAAGPQSALIDDVPGSLAPYDYYVIMGPEDSSALARRLAAALGCEAAIVDANDRQVAWAVGCSGRVDRRRLEALMSDNPAGNQDQQTPVVIVKGACREEAATAGRPGRLGAGIVAVPDAGWPGWGYGGHRASRSATVLLRGLGVAVAVMLALLAAHHGAPGPGPLWDIRGGAPGPGWATLLGARSPLTIAPQPGTGPVPRPVGTGGEVTQVAVRERVPILMYHAVAVGKGSLAGLYVTPSEFRAEVRYLKAHGYHTVTLSRLVEAWAGHATLPPRPVVITFDDGYRGDYLYALPELRKAGYVGTLFLTVDRLGAKGGLSSAMVKDLLAAGWELGSHPLTHPDLTRVPLPRLRREVEESRLALERQYGVQVASFCYPSGRFDARVEQEVRRAGYLAACGTLPGLADPGRIYDLPRIRVARGDGARGLAAKLQSFTRLVCSTGPARGRTYQP